MTNGKWQLSERTSLFFLKMEEDIPFVTANHYSLEHKQREQCQVQVERTKYPGGSKKKKKRRKKKGLEETWLTYENNYSWTDKQQNQMRGGTPAIVTGCCHLRIEPGGNIAVHTRLPCLLLSLPAFKGKNTVSPPTQFQLSLTKHFASHKKKEKKMKRKSMQRCVLGPVNTALQFLSAQSGGLQKMSM